MLWSASPWRRSAAGLAGCATADDATKPITYSLTAKQNYEKGLAELKDENYPEAQKYFQFVKQKFPFSKFAVLAELAIADSQFARGNYTEAIDSYKTFTRLHPTHDKVEDGYVAFKVGESYFKDMPDDIWLLPPSYEKDQSAVMDALRELDDFRRKFPDSKYQKAVEPFRKEVLQRLVDHEVYVARFYLGRDHPKAAALRLEGALRRYPGSGREPELLFALGETYLKMGDPARQGELPARRQRVPGRPARAPRGAVPRVHPQALRREPAGAAAARHAARRALRRRARPMDDRLRELLTRGREHYVAREYDKAERYLTEVARENLAYADVYDMLGVIYHQQGRLIDAESDVQAALRINPAYTEAALNLAVTLQRPRQVPRGQGGLRARPRGVEERAAQPRSVRARARSRTCTPTSAPPITRSGCTRTPCASTSARWRCARRSSTSAPGWARRCARWATSPRPCASSSACAPRTRASPAARLHLGLCYYAPGRREDATAEWRAVLDMAPDNKSAQMYLAMVRQSPQSIGPLARETPDAAIVGDGQVTTVDLTPAASKRWPRRS